MCTQGEECPYCVALGALEKESFNENWGEFGNLPPGTCRQILARYKAVLPGGIFLMRCANSSDSQSGTPGTLYPT
jgi:hypothetical protein